MLATFLTILAAVSCGLAVWQCLAGRRFPLHQRKGPAVRPPAISVLKPLSGCDAATQQCLRSWLEQNYPAEVEVLFGVASSDDPVCAVVHRLLAQRPAAPARLIVCEAVLGLNAKVSTLVQLERAARFEFVVASDADVFAPPDLLTELAACRERSGASLVHCLYGLRFVGDGMSLGARWEAVAINADFWTQVLQARTLAPMDFALGAVMALPRPVLRAAGGFEALLNVLADDYWLGRRVAGQGGRIELCSVPVECRGGSMSFREAWERQLRWARTIRVSKPVPYALSIVNNVTLWAGLLVSAAGANTWAVAVATASLGTRWWTAWWNECRMRRDAPGAGAWWLAPVKDILQAATWAGAFVARTVVWQGRRLRVRSDGSLETR
ncbi:MAG TPA: glycosyltransferase [Methylomirabilota bacterium]|nr:glycosyltransferase [Methylomirabilota bacterium]